MDVESLKRKTAKQILAESFYELAEEKSVDKITVTDITENCGYSTTTFYRHFKDKYDLMVWGYTHMLEEIMNRVGPGGSSWRQACLECARLFYKERTYLKNLLLNTSGFDAFSRNMMTIHFDAMKGMLQRGAGAGEIDIRTEMCARAYCHGAVDLSCEWIMGHYDVSPEALTQAFVDSLPVMLRPYLIAE